MDNLHGQLKDLTLQGLGAIAGSSFGVDGCRRAIAIYDTRKDDLITRLGAFQPAVDALGQIPAVQGMFGVTQARRLAIQFVFNACGRLADGSPPETAFEEVWATLTQEIDTPAWTYRAVANMQNIDSSQNVIELGDGVSVRGRSFEELSTLLNWGPRELDYLAKDWAEGAMSSFVLLVEKQVPKTPDNFIDADDGSAYPRAGRALLAMRLLASGDVRIGRLYLTKPAAFNVGIGGMQSSGFTVWHPGSIYRLAPDQAPAIGQLYQDLSALERRTDSTTRALLLALRSFSSIYDRLFHQAEDRVVDAITALEALWKLDVELSFRLAFRTAALLAASDDERVAIYRTLSEYYKIRSKVVHGGSLTEVQERQLHEDEPLREVVRRALRAFLHLAVHPGEWTLKRLHEEADTTLMHTTQRAALQAAMGI
jgi:hypothetical protein